MSTNFFYKKLGYEHLVRCSGITTSNPEYQELGKIGADKVYFSGDFPAILFKEVEAFDIYALTQIAQIQHKAWNYRKIMFLFVVSDTEIRIYNCHEKPRFIKSDSDYEKELSPYQIFRSTKEDEASLKILVEIFSRIGVDSGLLWTSDYNLRDEINVQKRIDRYLVESLLRTADALKEDITDTNIIHGLLMRSLFILYLEDKGAAKEAGLYREIRKDAESYFDILDDVDATYKLFAKLQDHFNGSVFPIIENEQSKVKKEHLEKIKKCFIDGDISGQPKLFENWRIFKFDFIQIELLSEVYENFLGELDAKKEKGQFYTPYTLVELILNDKLPIKNETNYNVKILDPACGSGIFLVESYKRLIRRWKNKNPEKVITFKELNDILVKNIFGIEIDPLAIKVTAFSLYLALVEHLNPKKLWIDKTNKFPYLIDNPNDISIKEKKGKNLWCRDTIGEVNPDDFEKVNLVIGNPPFGTKKLSKSIMDYCVKYNFGKEMVLPFLHKSIEFCPDGEIALIFNTKVLTNTKKTYQNFRHWLLNENYVEKLYNLSIFRKSPRNFGGQLFTSAIGPICIIYFQAKTPPKASNTIEYWAPKTYVKSNLIDGVLVDSTDIKFLPRTECQIPNSKIWKIAMWGNIADYNLIKRLSNTYPSLQRSFKDKVVYGVGLETSVPCKKTDENIKLIPHHTSKTIKRFYTPIDFGTRITNSFFRRLGYVDAYRAPHLLLNEGVQKNKLTASFLDYDCSYFKGIVGIISEKSDENILKLTCAFLNSSFAQYYAFMTTSSWGIERDVVKHQELFTIPFIIENFTEQKKQTIISLLDSVIKKQSQIPFGDYLELEDNINTILLDDLTEKDRIIITDSLRQIDLFQKGSKSKLLRHTTNNENLAYAEILKQELNDFYSGTGHGINIAVYDVQRHDPLNLVTLHFCKKEKPIEIKQTNELSSLLKELDKYSIQEKGKNIYVQKQFRYYDRDKIYLIKPNQKRFWTRSQAIDDALSLIVEIANLGTK